MKPLDNNNECSESAIVFPTIYRLARYTIRDKMFKYPTGAYFAGPYTFFQTKEEALVAIQDQKGAWDDYCFVLSEIPLGVPMRDGESFRNRFSCLMAHYGANENMHKPNLGKFLQNTVK